MGYVGNVTNLELAIDGVILVIPNIFNKILTNGLVEIKKSKSINLCKICDL